MTLRVLKADQATFSRRFTRPPSHHPWTAEPRWWGDPSIAERIGPLVRDPHYVFALLRDLIVIRMRHHYQTKAPPDADYSALRILTLWRVDVLAFLVCFPQFPFFHNSTFFGRSR